MFLFHSIYSLKFLVKSQPQPSYKIGSVIYIKKECIVWFICQLYLPIIPCNIVQLLYSVQLITVGDLSKALLSFSRRRMLELRAF